ncbi:response regulator [Oceanobacillus kapialis]|uniref:response regulator n=1 Tax=Oceanobacillus kapialis TaxID=481353 RepID=UPI00384F8170
MFKSEILIVDDQPGIRLLLTDILQTEGHLIDTAQTGKEAVDKLKEHTYHLVLLDYNLPIMDGGAILKYLEEHNITAPIIVMSGLADQLEEEISGYSNVKQVLGKPFNIVDVRNLTRQVLGS